MTTKITSLAMFAVAAFALSGMGLAPAFANNYPSFDHTYTSGVNVDSDDVSCGSSDRCEVAMWAVDGNDYINITFGVDGNTTCTQVDIYVSGAGWNEHVLGGYNISTEGNQITVYGPNDLEVDDEVTITGDFAGCS
jgi:hypothetical protein